MKIIILGLIITASILILYASISDMMNFEIENTDNELIDLIKSLVAKRLGIKIQVRAEIVSGMTNGPIEDTVQLAQEMFNAE